MSLADQWALLGLAPTDDKREIKRAYARKLKTVDVDSDPAAFIALREALEAATQWGTTTPWWERDDEDEDEPAVSFAAPEASPPSDAFADDYPYDDDDDSDENWRPERPAASAGTLDPLLFELETLLYAEGPADPARVRALGEALLADPELDQVDGAVAVEGWLAQAISATFPRSDPLLELCIRRFGWNRPGDKLRRDWTLERIEQRCEDLKFKSLLDRPSHPHRRAWEELTGPPREGKLGWRKTNLVRDVAEFLALLDTRSTLQADLNPESLAWWRSYLAGPHLPAHFPLRWGLATVLLAVVALILIGDAAFAPLVLLGLLGVSASLSFAAILGWAHIAARRRRRAETYWERETVPGAERFAAAALALPLPIALLPSHWAVTAVAIAACAGLAWKVWRSGWIEPDWAEPSTRPRLFLPGVAGAASLFAAVQLDLPRLIALGAALALAAWAGSHLFHPLAARIGALPAPRRLGLAVAALVTLAAAAAALGLTFGEEVRPAWVFALVPPAIVAVHLATAASTIDTHGFEWPLRGLLAVAYFTARWFWQGGFAAILFTLIACYGLGYAFVRLLYVLKDEAKASRHTVA